MNQAQWVVDLYTMHYRNRRVMQRLFDWDWALKDMHIRNQRLIYIYMADYNGKQSEIAGGKDEA